MSHDKKSVSYIEKCFLLPEAVLDEVTIDLVNNKNYGECTKAHSTH